jgi:hypothetical protein
MSETASICTKYMRGGGRNSYAGDDFLKDLRTVCMRRLPAWLRSATGKVQQEAQSLPLRQCQHFQLRLRFQILEGALLLRCASRY